MNKTIYIRDQDVPTWDRARELAGEKLSPVIITALQKYIVDKEAEEAKAKGFERIEVAYSDSMSYRLPRKKAFIGRWVFPPQKPEYLLSEDEPDRHLYALAITAKGNVVVLSWSEGVENGEMYSTGRSFIVYGSLEEAASDPSSNYVARQAFEKLGVPVEELDI